jgi:hypothetical protein
VTIQRGVRKFILEKGMRVENVADESNEESEAVRPSSGIVNLNVPEFGASTGSPQIPLLLILCVAPH